MNDSASSDRAEQVGVLQEARQILEPITEQFPISQAVASLAGTFDWLLDDASTEERWLAAERAFQFRFVERWRAIASRALDQSPRLVSDQALSNADYDPLNGSPPWGPELTRAFRAALAELGPVTGEAVGVLPDTERMRAHARAMNVQDSGAILPLVSYAPLLASEWGALLAKLTQVIDLALAFEGAVVVWLIGGFFRDLNGRLTLRPQLSLTSPPSGTRVKPVHVLLGTTYEEQCPSLLPLSQVAETGPRFCGSLLNDTLWQRVVVQLDMAVDDYHLLNLSRLSDVERDIARKVMYVEDEPRAQHVILGRMHDVPRPWRYAEPARELSAPGSLETRILPPRSALEAASVPAEQPPTAAGLREDAEELRRKGAAAAAVDPGIAQKYLLASTVLENSSVDVWLTLVDLAPTAKQKEAFRREAEKVLRRQQKSGS